MQKKYIFCFFFCLIFITENKAQSSSFQIINDEFQDSSYHISYKKLISNNHNEVIALGSGYDSITSYFNLIDITNGEGVNEGFSYRFSTYMFGNPPGDAEINYHDNRVTVMQQYDFGGGGGGDLSGLNIFSMDFSTGEGWLKGTTEFQHWGGQSDFDVDSSNNILMICNPIAFLPTTVYDSQNIFETYYLAEDGTTLRKKGYRLSDATLDIIDMRVNNVEYHPNGHFYISGHTDINNYAPDESFIIKIDSTGMPVAWKKIKEHKLNQLYIGASGDIYMLGKSIENFSFTENEENAVLLKLDENLNEVWTKVYHAENFEFSKVTMSIGSDNNLYLGYSTYGAFPVILAQLSIEGEILWEKGYPFYNPKISTMPNGSLLLLTYFDIDELNELIYQPILTKTDSLGNISSCETFPTCLEVNTISTTFESFQIDTFDIEDLEYGNVIIEPIGFNYIDYCNISPPPNPEFDFPDTICINSCETTFDTYNYFAHGIEWKLESQDVNILLQDSLNFEYCFSEAGDYVLTQTVWFLGCAYSFEKNIFVKDLDISITPDFVLCNEFPVELSVESSVPLSEYTWSSGATTSTIEIETTGEYFIEVSDGICMDADTINFVKLADESCPLNLTIPNVFTPDGDGLNDTFGPIDGEYYEMTRIVIFNRWGQKVYDGKNNWDGNFGNRPSPSDVYVYRLEYLNLLNDEVEAVIGEVTLVR